MPTFLRKIRRSLINSGAARKYMLYAIGEVLLVMIGILLALQVNNWNEERRAKKQLEQNLISLAEDIRKDTSILQNYIRNLEKQEAAARLIISVLESKERKITDSLAFQEAFGWMSRSLSMDFDREIWDEIRKAGTYKAYVDSQLVLKIQSYYHTYAGIAKNWESSNDIRLESRWLKYELLSQVDLDSARSEANPRPYSNNAYQAIFNEKRVIDLTKAIYFSSSLFKRYFETTIQQAVDILQIIDKEFGEDRVDSLLQ